MAAIYQHILFRRGTQAEWESYNPILNSGEPAYAYDTQILRIGDGINHYNDLNTVSNSFSQNDITLVSGLLNSVSGILNNKINTDISSLVDGAPDLLNTLNELAAAINDDENFASTFIASGTKFINDLNAASGSLNTEISTLTFNVAADIATASGSLNNDINNLSGIVTINSNNISTLSGIINAVSGVGYLTDISSENIQDLNNVTSSLDYPLTVNEYILVYDSGISAFKGSSINLGLIKQGSIPLAGYSNSYLGYYIRMNSSEFTVNEQGTDLDFRVEGDTDSNLLFTDASTDRVGIGTSTPQAKLDVNGTVQFDNLVRWEYPDKALDTSSASLGYIRLYDETGFYAGLGVSTASFNIGTSGAINFRTITNGIERTVIDTNGNFIFNEAGNNCDFRIEGDTDQYLLFTDASLDRVSIGTASMNGKFNVTDSSTNTSYRYLNYNFGSHTSSTNGTYYVFGDNINVYKLVNSGVIDAGYAIGSELVAALNGDGTLTSTYGLRTYAGIQSASSAGTNTMAYGIQSRVINFGSGSSLIGEARGVDIYINGDLANTKASTGITTAKALNIQTILDATNKWAIYQEGANDSNYLNGSVGIGTTSPSAKLNVEGGNVIFNDLGGNYDFRVEGDTDQYLFCTDASVDSIGIGTSIPAAPLHLVKPKNAIYGSILIQDSTSIAANVGGSIVFGGKYTSGGDYARFGQIASIKENSTDGNSQSALSFSINSGSSFAEKMRINSSGNLGIGTSTPTYKLDVVGTGNFSHVISSGCPTVISNTGIASGSDQILNIVSLTQAEYDAATKNNQTLYVITD